jgi:hypothetical protein
MQTPDPGSLLEVDHLVRAGQQLAGVAPDFCALIEVAIAIA